MNKMSVLGEIFGYDAQDNDFLGYPRNSKNACLVCGVSVFAHTPEMHAECAHKLFAAERKSDAD